MELQKQFDCWKILGIEGTSDQKTIKRAYLSLLKKTNPEEKPEEFMLLREAYENALVLGPIFYTDPGVVQDEQGGANPDEATSASIQSEVSREVESRKLSDDPVDGSSKDKANDSEFITVGDSRSMEREPVEDDLFDEQVKTLYSDFEKRINFRNWIDLETHWDLVDLKNRLSISHFLLCFFAINRHLPQEIIRHYNELFHWTEDMLAYKNTYPGLAYRLDELDDRIQLIEWNLDYECLLGLNGLDEYLEARDRMIERLLVTDLMGAREILERLAGWCPHDSTLQRVKVRIRNQEAESQQRVPVTERKMGNRSGTWPVYLIIVMFIGFSRVCTSLYNNNPISGDSFNRTYKPENYLVHKDAEDYVHPYKLAVSVPVLSLGDSSAIGTIGLYSEAENSTLIVDMDVSARQFTAPDYYSLEKGRVMESGACKDNFTGSLIRYEGRIYALCHSANNRTLIIAEVTDLEKISVHYTIPANERLFFFFVTGTESMKSHESLFYKLVKIDIVHSIDIWKNFAEAQGIFSFQKE